MAQFVREYKIAQASHYMDEKGILAVRLAIVPLQAIKMGDYRSVDLEFLGDDASAASKYRAGGSIEFSDYEVVQRCAGSRMLLVEWGVLLDANKG